MYVARLLVNDADPADVQADLDEEDWRVDPNLPTELLDWAKGQKPSPFAEVVSKLDVFSEREIARKVHLMYMLNIMSSVIGGFFNRNEKTSSLLDDYKEDFSLKDVTYDRILSSLEVVRALKLESHTFWSAKASFFSLIVAIAKRLEAGEAIDATKTRDALMAFAAKPDDTYVLAAREAVNNKKERQLRHQHVAALLKA